MYFVYVYIYFSISVPPIVRIRINSEYCFASIGLLILDNLYRFVMVMN